MTAGFSAPTSRKGQIQRLVYELLGDHYGRDEIPTNGRFVFYELEQAGVVRKSKQGESRRGKASAGEIPREQDVSDALLWLRDKGIVPWEWIKDETRSLADYSGYDSILGWALAGVSGARLDPWDGTWPLLICESRSLKGVLERIAHEYRCEITATNGQAGGFLRTGIVPRLRGNDRPVLYLGDLDHQGGQIEENTRRVLERETGERPWTRVAITMEQVDERDLEPIWKKDHRYQPPLEHEAWETEALGQATVMAFVREELERLLPEPLPDVLEREEEEREQMRVFLEGLGGAA